MLRCQRICSQAVLSNELDRANMEHVFIWTGFTHSISIHDVVLTEQETHEPNQVYMMHVFILDKLLFMNTRLLLLPIEHILLSHRQRQTLTNDYVAMT